MVEGMGGWRTVKKTSTPPPVLFGQSICHVSNLPENRTGGAPDLPRLEGTPIWPLRRHGNLQGAILVKIPMLPKRPENRTRSALDHPHHDGIRGHPDLAAPTPW